MKQPKWQRRAEDRPHEICSAALEVFAEKGFAAAKLDEIARRAGVSKGTLYLYFSDKQELFRAVIRDTISPNIEAVRASLEQTDLPLEEIVRTFLPRFAALAEKLPIGAVAKMVIGESRNFPEIAKVWHDVVLSNAIGTIARIIERAQELGEVRPGDPRLQAFSLMGAMMMGVIWRETLEPVGGAPVDLERLGWQHAETILAGLLVRDGE
ncbi:MAG: TetR/AcrR family transcriptional regulator [Sphingomonas sp.]|nr:TetR/AcrR family transcriptional regulator [Sphingomonas sp.]